MKFILLCITLLMTVPAFSLVDMKNGNYTFSETDLSLPGTGYFIRVHRTYNSRNLFNGMFGFGWCTDFETSVEKTAENNIKVTECGGGQEVTYLRKDFQASDIAKTNAKIIKEVSKRNKSLTREYLAKLKKDLIQRPFLREELTRQLGFGGQIKEGAVYTANGRKDERVVFSKGKYTRYLADGTFQRFSKDGHLTALYDRNNNHIKITRQNGQILKIADNMARTLTFKYHPGIKKVHRVVGPKGLKMEYLYKGEDLVSAKNALGQTTQYATDSIHNITKVITKDPKTKKSLVRKLTYNKDKDWVTSFTDYNGCVEGYQFGDSKTDPLNDYWSKITKTCDGKVTNKSHYRFVHKFNTKGSRYLHMAYSKVNGFISEIVYHPILGRPTKVKNGNQVVNYDYNENGLIKKKQEPSKTTQFIYKNACNKVSALRVDFFSRLPSSKAKGKFVKKLAKTITTNYQYSSDKKCNLKTAKSSSGQYVTLGHDLNGRITSITDQTRKKMTIKYDKELGRPNNISRPGLGSLLVRYNPDGSVKEANSPQGATVAAQVAGIFSNLLELIGPATSELSI